MGVAHHGHLLAPSPQTGGMETPDPAGCLSKAFSFGKRGVLGGDDILAGRRQPEDKSRMKKTIHGHR